MAEQLLLVSTLNLINVDNLDAVKRLIFFLEEGLLSFLPSLMLCRRVIGSILQSLGIILPRIAQ